MNKFSAIKKIFILFNDTSSSHSLTVGIVNTAHTGFWLCQMRGFLGTVIAIRGIIESALRANARFVPDKLGTYKALHCEIYSTDRLFNNINVTQLFLTFFMPFNYVLHLFVSIQFFMGSLCTLQCYFYFRTKIFFNGIHVTPHLLTLLHFIPAVLNINSFSNPLAMPLIL